MESVMKLLPTQMSELIPKQRTARTMRYPYTLTAKIAQFPYAFYYKHVWLFRYYCYAMVISAPLFWKIQKLSCSDANYAALAERRRKEAEEHKH